MKKKLDYTLILSGLAVLGVAATGVLAAMRAPRYLEILNTGAHPVIATAKAQWPAIVAGMTTAACIIASQRIGAKALAGTLAAAGYLAKHRDALIEGMEEYCSPAQSEAVKKYAMGKLMCTAGPSVEETERGDLLCFEGWSGRWFRSSEEAVHRAFDELNERFCEGEYVCLNDLYELLGIAKTHFGNRFGWAANPDYYDSPIDWEGTLFDAGTFVIEENAESPVVNEDVYAIDIFTYPMECWMEV